MQAMLDHQRCDRRDLDHLMAQRIWILSPKQRAATAAGIRVFHHVIHPLDRQQFWSGPGMALLAAALAATALTPCWRLKTGSIAGGRPPLLGSLAAKWS